MAARLSFGDKKPLVGEGDELISRHILECEIIKNPDVEDDNSKYSDDEEIFFEYSDYLEININLTRYRWFLILTGMWLPGAWRARRPHSVYIKLMVFRIIIAIVLLSFMGYELGLFCLCWEKTWLDLNTKFPFTIANAILWNMRWLVTYLSTAIYCSKGHLVKFSKSLKIPLVEWWTYKNKLNFYLLFMFFTLILYPCALLWFDLHWQDTHDMIKMGSFPNFFIIIWKLVCRLIMLPSFCLVTIVLYLLGNHILAVGKRICVYPPKVPENGVNELKAEIKAVKNLIKKTESALSFFLVAHMFLLTACAFTTLMSTIERLKFSSNVTNNSSSLPLTVVEQNLLPINDLVTAKLVLQESKRDLEVAKNKSNQTKLDTHISALYEKILASQEMQMNIIEKLAQKTKIENASINPLNSESNSFYKFVVGLEDRRGVMRVILDDIWSIIEILVLYIVPLFLIIRIDDCINKTVGYVTDVQVAKQMVNGWTMDTEDKLKKVQKYISTVEGVRVFGFQIQFFKTLLLATFAPFFAIALRGIWKHYGFF